MRELFNISSYKLMKIGIIGGGLAGLTCAYRLAQKGIKAVVFEKSVVVGGRVPFCGAVATKKFHFNLISLIEELGLEELEIPLLPKEEGFFTAGGQLMGMGKMPMMAMKSFGVKDMLYFMKLNRFVNGARFNVRNPDPKLLELRSISFEEYLKNCPMKVRKIAIEPMKIFTYENDLTKISAEFGLTHIRLANELGSGKAFTFEESNIATVTNVLALKLREKGTEVLTIAKVNRVQKEGERFKIIYESGVEKTETVAEVDKVVLATPLTVTKEIFPELGIETDVEYKISKCLFTEGKLKWPEMKFIIGMPGNPANLRALFGVVSYAHLVYPMDDNKPVDLNQLYDEYKISDEQVLNPAMPIVGPKARIPELQTKIEGAYLCGDFYYYPWLETAVDTAETVADLIAEAS